jgi:2-polyprenyl-3-methyl-5-hydroxy-6-metoxy-1,4-benzoquinol methylase
MAECRACNVCDNPGTPDTSPESARIASNVRRFHKESFTVWRCANCCSLHSMEDADLDHYYKGYLFQSQHLDFHTRLGYRNRLKLLRKHGLTRESRVLDYGCGNGLFVQFLRGQGYAHVAGFDAYAPQYQDRGVLDQTFDLIVSFDVIEHVEQPRDFVTELAGRLRAGGLLVIGTPNAQRLSLSFPMALELHQPYHRHILSQQALLGLGTRCGLTTVEVVTRHWLDTLVPTANSRFLWEYVYRAGGLVDAGLEGPRLGMIARSPRLWFFALAGYFVPARGNMIAVFRK